MNKLMLTCPICDSKFQFGPQVYNGRHIPSYNLTVCSTCYEGNWEGWAPIYEQRLVDHLKKEGLPIPGRNEKGWLPRG